MVVLVVDHGAGNIKIGYSTDVKPRLIPNCISKAKNVKTRIFIGDQIDDIKDMSGLYFLLPFQKGYLTNWEVEKQIWDYVYGKDCMAVDFPSTDIIITEPQFNFRSVQEVTDEILFEEYQFNSVLRTTSAYLSQHKYCREGGASAFQPPPARIRQAPLGALVVDSGYSYTHIVPYCKGVKLTNAVRRIDVGGKVLTNHLKEVVSYRQLMVMDETHVMNQCKEDVCYVAKVFKHEVEIAGRRAQENTVQRDYVLPDYTHVKRGYVRNDSCAESKDLQVIRVNIERFAVPELLFHPADVGVPQMGIPEAIVHCVSLVEPAIRPHLLNNIVLTGGNCLFPNFRNRVETDVREEAESDFDVGVHQSDSPHTYAWEGGKLLAGDAAILAGLAVTRQHYEECGPDICKDKFKAQ